MIQDVMHICVGSTVFFFDSGDTCFCGDSGDEVFRNG